MIAVQNGYFRTVEALLDLGADIHAVDKVRHTAQQRIELRLKAIIIRTQETKRILFVDHNATERPVSIRPCDGCKGKIQQRGLGKNSDPKSDGKCYASHRDSGECSGKHFVQQNRTQRTSILI